MNLLDSSFPWIWVDLSNCYEQPDGFNEIARMWERWKRFHVLDRCFVWGCYWRTSREAHTDGLSIVEETPKRNIEKVNIYQLPWEQLWRREQEPRVFLERGFTAFTRSRDYLRTYQVGSGSSLRWTPVFIGFLQVFKNSNSPRSARNWTGAPGWSAFARLRCWWGSHHVQSLSTPIMVNAKEMIYLGN